MRSIASCYSEHAIKVSDSYCSSRPSNQAYLCPKLNNPCSMIQDSVSCIYKVNMISSQKQFLITITWTKKLIGQGFTINITTNIEFPPSKFNTNPTPPLQLRKNRGDESFKVRNFDVRILWDLSAAKYNEGPEPKGEFYVVVLVDSELGLRLGDKDDEIDETLDLSIMKGNFSMVSRSERFSGTTVYATRAKFSESGDFHDILIRCVAEEEGLKMNHVLSVCLDKKTVFQVKRLRWNFRGNQTIFVDGLVVDMMWDVHDWLFNPNSDSSAVFLFRTRSGLDSRLWFEEKNLQTCKEHERIGFSLLICACKNPD